AMPGTGRCRRGRSGGRSWRPRAGGCLRGGGGRAAPPGSPPTRKKPGGGGAGKPPPPRGARRVRGARPKAARGAPPRPGRGRWRAPDLVKRQFPATRLNCKWYGDGTEIPTGEGKLYLASVMDAASRRILGFTLSEHHDAGAAYGALAMAITLRGGQVPGVIMHTDQGSEGGFNWSSQHLDLEVLRYGCRETPAGDSCDARADVVARQAVDRAARGSRAVLGGDRPRRVERGRGSRDGCVAGRWLEVVPAGWRDAAHLAGPAVGAVPVVR